MTSDAYRTAIAALGLTQIGAARALGIGLRTSRRYAAQGVPERISPYIIQKLKGLETSK